MPGLICGLAIVFGGAVVVALVGIEAAVSVACMLLLVWMIGGGAVKGGK